MPLEPKDFRREFEQLFIDTKDAGSLTISFKRIVYPYQRKKAAAAPADPVKPSAVAPNIRCIVRAKTNKKKISTIVYHIFIFSLLFFHSFALHLDCCH